MKSEEHPTCPRPPFFICGALLVAMGLIAREPSALILSIAVLIYGKMFHEEADEVDAWISKAPKDKAQ